MFEVLLIWQSPLLYLSITSLLNILQCTIHCVHTYTHILKFSASPGQKELPAAMHKLFTLHGAASGLLQLFWEIYCALLVNGRIRWTGLGDFASLGDTNPLLLLPKRLLLCTLSTGRKGAISLGYFYRAVGRLHVSLWPHAENGSFTHYQFLGDLFVSPRGLMVRR